MSDFWDRALQIIRVKYPDADQSCFSGRYHEGYWNDEPAFIDAQCAWEYPGRWYPGPMRITDDEFVAKLVEDGLETLEKSKE